MLASTSPILLSDQLWPTLRGIDRCDQHVMAAFAYFTHDHLNLQEGDVLIVDASVGNVKSRSIDAQLLSKLFDRGVQIHTHPGLHAKVMLIGAYAVIGSANSSLNSELHLTEAAVISSDMSVRIQVSRFLDQLQHPDVSPLLSAKDIRRLCAIKPNPKTPLPRTKPMTFTTQEPVWWWLGIGPLSPRILKREAHDIESGNDEADDLSPNPDAERDHIRWQASASIAKRVQVGDIIFQAYSETRGNPKTTAVLAPAKVLLIKRKDNWVRFHVEYLDEYRERVSLAKAQAALSKLGPTKLTGRSARALRDDEVQTLDNILKARAR